MEENSVEKRKILSHLKNISWNQFTSEPSTTYIFGKINIFFCQISVFKEEITIELISRNFLIVFYNKTLCNGYFTELLCHRILIKISVKSTSFASNSCFHENCVFTPWFRNFQIHSLCDSNHQNSFFIKLLNFNLTKDL